MIDPAITGLIGTGLGAFIGFGGTALTSYATGRRERATRLFTEKRATYAKALEFYYRTREKDASYRTLWLDVVTNDPDFKPPADEWEKHNEHLTEVGLIENELRLVGSRSVQKALASFSDAQQAFAEGARDYHKKYRSVGAENVTKDETQAVLAMSAQAAVALKKLAEAMREDLGVPD